MKIVATIEARMTSSRLPGKVLLEAGGKPMLEHLLDRLKRVPSLNDICLATTVNHSDDCLEEFALRHGISCYRGSEDDVMDRVIKAAKSRQADLICEITGDCPIIDHEIVEQVIRMFQSNRCDYASNAHIRTYPDGMDTQVFRLETLRRSEEMTCDPLDREHVTLHIRKHPEIFKQVHLVAPPSLHWPELGLTLDEPNDYQLLRRIIEHFGVTNPYFSCHEAIDLLRRNPDWIAINRDVRRKGGE